MSFLCGWYSNTYFIFPWTCIICRIYIIESCIKDVFSWLVANKLSADPQKTEYLLFNSRNINLQVININLDSDVISLCYSAKNLGVLFQSDMSLDNHISSIIKSCFVQLRAFRHIRSLISKTAAITLANSFYTFSPRLLQKPIFMVSLVTPSTVCKRLKIQLFALLHVVSVHQISLWFLNLCIGYLLTTVLISRFHHSSCAVFTWTSLSQFSVQIFDLILIPFVLSLLAHYYYHTSMKNHMVFVHFHMLHLISGITYLILFIQHQPICRLEKI